MKRHFRNEISVFAPRRPEAVKWLKAFPSKSSNKEGKAENENVGKFSIQLPGFRPSMRTNKWLELPRWLLHAKPLV